MRSLVWVLAGLVFLICDERHGFAEPLPVYILVGQSNMQGHAQARTLAYLAEDPQTAPLLAKIQTAEGEPRIYKQVWISSIGADGSEAEKHGQLTVGYGAEGGGPKIGPELTFGITMQKHLGRPILLIKTAWGGKSLNTDFRPPGSGPYEFNQGQLDRIRKQKKDLKKIEAEKRKATGKYYRLMVQHVRRVLADIKRIYPDYDAESGYELSGLVWFQGWNDMVDSGTYPNRYQPGGYDAYSRVLAQFIRDVRKDLAAPDLPFVIGVMGVGGPLDKYGPEQERYKPVHGGFRDAMAAPASLLEFKGSVVAVRTADYWDPRLSELANRWDKVRARNRQLNQNKQLTREERKEQLDQFTAELFTEEELRVWKVGTSNAAYHYLGCGKTMAQIGKAFADALADLGTP